MNINVRLFERARIGHLGPRGVGFMIVLLLMAMAPYETLDAADPISGNARSTCWGGSCVWDRDAVVPNRSPLEAGMPVDRTAGAEAVVRVENVLQDPRSKAAIVSRASGVLVALESGEGRLGVLTVAHLFREGVGRVSIAGNRRSASAAELLAIDRKWDLAVLRLLENPGESPVPLAENWPVPGERVHYCGFTSGGPLVCRKGEVNGYISTHITGGVETMLIFGHVRQGDSGGPVLNRRGELVGLIWGTDGRAIYATYGGRIRRFLREAGIAPRSPESELRGIPPSPPRPVEPPAPESDHGDPVPKVKEKNPPRSVSDKPRSSEQVPANPLQEMLRQRLLLRSLAMLGISGPTALVVVWTLRFLWHRWKRRKGREEAVNHAESKKMPDHRPLNDEYAAQLAGVYALSGRSPTADATLGRLYDEELKRAATSSDGNLVAFAHSMRDRVADKFYRIHDWHPLPAEPIPQE